MLSRLFSLAVAAALALPAAQTGSDARLRVVIAGLVHGHVGGFLNLVKNRQDVEIVGVFEPDVQLETVWRPIRLKPGPVLHEPR